MYSAKTESWWAIIKRGNPLTTERSFTILNWCYDIFFANPVKAANQVSAGGYFSTLGIIFLHFEAKHLCHQDTKTQRWLLTKGFVLCLGAFVANLFGLVRVRHLAGEIGLMLKKCNKRCCRHKAAGKKMGACLPPGWGMRPACTQWEFTCL